MSLILLLKCMTRKTLEQKLTHYYLKILYAATVVLVNNILKGNEVKQKNTFNILKLFKFLIFIQYQVSNSPTA